MTRTSIDYYVDKVVAAAPELTPEQKDRLAVILRGYRPRARGEGVPAA